MSKIGQFSELQNLDKNYITIVERVNSNGQSVETQKATLETIYNWLRGNNHTYNMITDQITVSGPNLNKEVNENDNIVTLNFELPIWKDNLTYNPGEIVLYKGCIYRCFSTTTTVPTNGEFWYCCSYGIGRHLQLDSDNILSGFGIDTWTAGTTYHVNDFVINNKKLYKCLIDNSDENFIEDNWLNIGEGNGIIEYKANKVYNTGDIIIKDNKLYKRLINGADTSWIPEHWVCISNNLYSKVFIKYSHLMPTTNAELKDIPDDYMGIYVGMSETAPINYAEYKWYRIKGYVNVESNSVVINLTLSVDDWSNLSPFTLTITNDLFKNLMSPVIDISLSDDVTNWSNEEAQYSLIKRATCEDGQITFYCLEKPTEDINVKVRINGDVNSDSFVTKQEFNDFKDAIGNINALLENALGGN